MGDNNKHNFKMAIFILGNGKKNVFFYMVHIYESN